MTRLPPIDHQELAELARAYGQPSMRTISMEGDEYLFATRLYRRLDRRGEIVLAIERPGHQVLLHRKGWYAPQVYRLLTGGIGMSESVEDALSRELMEETGLSVQSARLLGVLDCLIQFAQAEVSFVSYVFHLPHTRGALRLPQTEDIADFREVPISDLAAVAEDLRQVAPPRTGWGRWRAHAHHFVHQALTEPEACAAGE